MLLVVVSRYATVIAGESRMTSFETFHKGLCYVHP